LIDHGYTVVTARDGEKGISMYSLHSDDLFGEKIAVVISDIGLPKLGGDEVYKRIKALDPDANIILASGYLDPGIKNELQQAGAKHFIKKPYIPVKVLRTIREILDQKNK